MHTRPYRESDRDECLRSFDSNTPACFVPEQRVTFEAFLDHHPDGYFVVVDSHQVIGCGGIDVHDGTAELCWIVVRSDWQRQGAGSLLMTACVLDTLSRVECTAVFAVANQQARTYFERWGLRVSATTPDGIAPGIDRVEMRMELTDSARALWQELISGGLQPPEAEESIPAIESYKEWTAHRYDPGHYLGGRLAPHLDTTRMGTHGKRRSAYLLAITALISTGGYLTTVSIDDSRTARIGGTALVVISWAAAGRMFLSSRSKNSAAD